MRTSIDTPESPARCQQPIVSSLWAKRFLQECPSSYKEAIRRAGEPVGIYKTDENGKVQWAVSLEDGFWLDAFKTRKQAKALVAKMGWPLIGANVLLDSANVLAQASRGNEH